MISGEDVFRLYDTYGFPVELTEEYAAEEGMKVDHDGFEREMERQRERARAARQDVDSMQVQGGVLGDIKVESTFVGYEQLSVSSVVEVIVKDGQLVNEVRAGEEAQVILRETPFYAESGGQIADRGWIEGETGKAYVKDVQKAPNGQHLHHIVVEHGVIQTNGTYTAHVDEAARVDIVKNHTATHLLHQALKDVLGVHVNQAGSLVAPDRLRFDFTHFGQVKQEELEQIEAIVNEQIWRNLPVNIDYKPLDEAKAMGAMALFGESMVTSCALCK